MNKAECNALSLMGSMSNLLTPTLQVCVDNSPPGAYRERVSDRADERRRKAKLASWRGT